MEYKVVDVPEKPECIVQKRPSGDYNQSDKELAFIEKLAKEAPLKKYLEIGVYKGTTTTLLAQYGVTIAVDWFAGNPESNFEGWTAAEEEKSDRLQGFLKSVQRMNLLGSVVVLSGKSDDVLPFLSSNKFGLVLVDANHSEEFAYRDIANTWDTIAEGGWLLLDDFTSFGERRVAEAWARFAKERGLESLVLYSIEQEKPKLVAIQKPKREE